jgi:hypothetical protein
MEEEKRIRVDTSIDITNSNVTTPFEPNVKLYLERSKYPTDETGIIVVKEGKSVQGTWIYTEDVPKLIEKLKEVLGK